MPNVHPPGLLNKLLGRSDIYFGGSLYMRRWRFISTPWFGVRLHHIVRSDNDRELHDHPFTFLSFILAGGYFEWRNRKDAPLKVGEMKLAPPDAEGWRKDISYIKMTSGQIGRWYGPGSHVLRRAEDLHRLELKKEWDEPGNNAGPPGYLPQLKERSAWTLVFRGPVRRQWGFETEKGWVPATDFVSKRERETA